ncbi:MAG: signal peptidase II [Microbacteriaceae bacterium]
MPSEVHNRSRPKWSYIVLIVVIAGAVLGIDQLSKLAIESQMKIHETWEIIPGLFNFFYVLNPGAAFSIGSGATWIFTIIISVVIVAIIWFAPRIRSIPWALMLAFLLGGTMGNLYDRLFREPGFAIGHVVDFLQITFFPAIFNVADVFIVSSMCLFVLLTILGLNIDGSRHKRPSANSELDGEETVEETLAETVEATSEDSSGAELSQEQA